MATQTASRHDVKVGEIFVCSWGYDQTNIDFYEVVGVTPTGVRLLKINAEVVASNGYSDKLMPKPGSYRRTRDGEVPKPFFRKVSAGAYGPWISLNSYSGAGRWEGRAYDQTDARFGH